MTTYIFKIISLLGGLALFLFGMDIMGKALERQAGGKLQTILSKMSGKVWKGFLLGAAVTAVIQSSSATTVMVVGFVNSGIMTLKQAVGVIMGSNVGTTVTAWILSLSGLEGDSFLIKFFKPSTLAPLIGIVGIILYMGKSEKRKGVGTIMLGFMALMTGMDLMSSSMSFLKTEAWFADLMISFTNPIVGILFGAVLTAIIQSSSASVGILQGLCVTGAVTYGAAIPIILGQNIGTCVTAMMGALGANRNARRTAMVHLLFNVVGVLMFVVIFYGLGLFIDWKFLSESVRAWDISVIHTGFNLIATAVLLPMNGLLVKLAYAIVPEVKEPEKTELLDERLLATPAVAVQRAHEIAGEMAAKKTTSAFMAEIIRWLNVKLAPCISVHGVLVDVYGEGVLITGESGIGKSEAALELIKRGHRLVTDDVVELRKVSDDTLIGSAPDITKHLIELRGIGIVDVKALFGASSVKDTQSIDLVIRLEDWDKDKEYDRLGLEENYTEYLGNKIVCHNIPIRPGRNLAIICESAAVNHRQKKMGYNAAQELYSRVQNSLTKRREEEDEE